MAEEKKKKIGSFKPKEEKKKFDIWEYKSYLLVGLTALVAVIIFFFVLRNLSKNPALQKAVPTPTATAAAGDTGTLKVETQPQGAWVQLFDQGKRTPAVFENVNEGQYFIIISYPNYKTVSKEVEIKKDETTTVNVQMEK